MAVEPSWVDGHDRLRPRDFQRLAAFIHEYSGIKVPPCFIVVCQNTAISKLVYDFVSGFQRKNEDGTQSYITIDPGIGGIELVRDDQAAKPTLVLRDAQHEYRFVATR